MKKQNMIGQQRSHWIQIRLLYLIIHMDMEWILYDIINFATVTRRTILIFFLSTGLVFG